MGSTESSFGPQSSYRARALERTDGPASEAHCNEGKLSESKTSSVFCPTSCARPIANARDVCRMRNKYEYKLEYARIISRRAHENLVSVTVLGQMKREA